MSVVPLVKLVELIVVLITVADCLSPVELRLTINASELGVTFRSPWHHSVKRVHFYGLWSSTTQQATVNWRIHLEDASKHVSWKYKIIRKTHTKKKHSHSHLVRPCLACADVAVPILITSVTSKVWGIEHLCSILTLEVPFLYLMDHVFFLLWYFVLLLN